MDRIQTLPTFPPPTYQQANTANAAEGENAAAGENPAVQHDARPIDQFQVLDGAAPQGPQNNTPQNNALQNNTLRKRGLSDVMFATVSSVASTSLAGITGMLLGELNLFGFVSGAGSIIWEGLAVQRMRKNPATTPNVSLRHTLNSLGGTICGGIAGVIIGVNDHPTRATWAAFGLNVGAAVLLESAGTLAAYNGVNARTRPANVVLHVVP